MKLEDMDIPPDKAVTFAVDGDNNVTDYQELEITGPVTFFRFGPLEPCTTCGAPAMGFHFTAGEWRWHNKLFRRSPKGTEYTYCYDHQPEDFFLHIL